MEQLAGQLETVKGRSPTATSQAGEKTVDEIVDKLEELPGGP